MYSGEKKLFMAKTAARDRTLTGFFSCGCWAPPLATVASLVIGSLWVRTLGILMLYWFVHLGYIWAILYAEGSWVLYALHLLPSAIVRQLSDKKRYCGHLSHLPCKEQRRVRFSKGPKTLVMSFKLMVWNENPSQEDPFRFLIIASCRMSIWLWWW